MREIKNKSQRHQAHSVLTLPSIYKSSSKLKKLRSEFMSVANLITMLENISKFMWVLFLYSLSPLLWPPVMFFCPGPVLFHNEERWLSGKILDNNLTACKSIIAHCIHSRQTDPENIDPRRPIEFKSHRQASLVKTWRSVSIVEKRKASVATAGFVVIGREIAWNSAGIVGTKSRKLSVFWFWHYYISRQQDISHHAWLL